MEFDIKTYFSVGVALFSAGVAWATSKAGINRIDERLNDEIRNRDKSTDKLEMDTEKMEKKVHILDKNIVEFSTLMVQLNRRLEEIKASIDKLADK